jgi:hypothetical protein
VRRIQIVSTGLKGDRLIARVNAQLSRRLRDGGSNRLAIVFVGAGGPEPEQGECECQ